MTVYTERYSFDWSYVVIDGSLLFAFFPLFEYLESSLMDFSFSQAQLDYKDIITDSWILEFEGYYLNIMVLITI